MVLPLEGIKVVEFAGLAPGPFAGLILADWGASVVRVDRAGQIILTDVLSRGKRSLAVDLKNPDGRNVLKELISGADVLIDPFRPGVLERLGLGPGVFLRDGLNKKLVYARLSGFPRTGPYKDMAGHDINYLALSGVLAMLPGASEKPTFPLNLLADFAGGGLTCALGILLALRSRQRTGEGQVVETDMVSGTRYLASFPLLHYLIPNSPTFGNADSPGNGRGTKLLDGGAPFYGVYTCSDGRWVSVGCLEPQFFRMFIDKFVEALPGNFRQDWNHWIPDDDARTNESSWPRLRSFLDQGFKTKSRDEWARVFHGSDACVAPVLSPGEAANDSHGSVPAPHPVLSGLQCSHSDGWTILRPGQHTTAILQEMGYSHDRVKGMTETGAFGRTSAKL